MQKKIEDYWRSMIWRVLALECHTLGLEQGETSLSCFLQHKWIST